MKRNYRTARRFSAILMAIVMLVTTAGGYSSKAEAEATDNNAAYATIRSLADFRSYIDNENPYSVQETVTTDWKGDTGVSVITVPSEGTLFVCCLSENGYADGYLYTDFALTSELGKANGCESSRDKISSFAVNPGTYYYKASRWNGTGDLTVTTFLGFMPKNTVGITYSDTSAKFDMNNNVPVISVDTKEGLAAYIDNGGDSASVDTITTDWRGYSEAHSFTVEESGWLLVYPLCENNNIEWELFTDAGLTSRILHKETVTGTQEEPYSCYLNAGTYYYHGNRWNGTKDLSFTTYLGFIRDSARFSVVSNVLSADRSYASVTFQGSGLIRVVEGEFDPANIFDTVFWKMEDRANALVGNTATITKNGNYVARLETSDGLYVMVPFTVTGVVEAVTPAPTATVSPAPAETPSKKEKKVYKITVNKKKLTVKAGKKAKIKYTVTKGYKGSVKLKSSKKKIATVSSKNSRVIVKGRKKGKCKITLSLSNGKKAVVNVTVK